MSGSAHDNYMKSVFSFDVAKHAAGAVQAGQASRAKQPGADETKSAAAARAVVEAIGRGTFTKEDGYKLDDALTSTTAKPLEAFLDTLMRSGAGVEEFTAGHGVEVPEAATVEFDSTIVIPTSKEKVERGGFKVVFSAQIYEETSDSVGIEVYSDVSASAGFSVDIPLGPAKFKVGVDTKAGVKASEKHEHKSANRTGQTISRSFTVRHLTRDVTNYQSKKVLHNPTKIGGRSGMFAEEPTYMGTSVSHRTVGVTQDIQNGYQVVPDEGGQPWGPFWDQGSGTPGSGSGSGLAQAQEVLTRQKGVIAKDLAGMAQF